MKTFVVLAVSIVLVGIFFCPMAMSAPSMPADLQIVQPDPSLPKELSAFFGKWEGRDNYGEYFLIVEKIDEGKASLYWYMRSAGAGGEGWERTEGNVTKDRGKYKVWYSSRFGTREIILKGEYLNVFGPGWNINLRRVVP